MTIDNFAAITIQPLMGAKSDKTWSDKWGRRMPYLLIGIPLSAFFFMLIPFFIPNDIFTLGNYSFSLSSDLVSFGFLTTWIICFDISMAIYRAPVTALLPDLIEDVHRSKGNGVIQLMGGIGGIFALTVGAILYGIGAEIPFLVASILMVISLIIMVLKIKEPKFTVVEGEQKEHVSLIKGFKEVFLNEDRSILLILLVAFCWYFGYQAVATWFTTYGVKILYVKEATASSYITLIAVPFIIMTVPSGLLGEKITRKKTILIGFLLIVACFVMVSIYSLLFVTPVNPLLIPLAQMNPPTTLSLLIFIIFPIMGVSWALIEVNSITIVWNIAGSKKQGTYTGIFYFFSQAAAILSPPIVGLFFDLVGSPLPLFPICLIFFIIALILMPFIKSGEIKKHE